MASVKVLRLRVSKVSKVSKVFKVVKVCGDCILPAGKWGRILCTIR